MVGHSLEADTQVGPAQVTGIFKKAIGELFGMAFDSHLEQNRIILVCSAAVSELQRLLIGCQTCSDDAELPFDAILHRVTGNDPSLTNYVLEHPANCPRCRSEITEKTLVELDPIY